MVFSSLTFLLFFLPAAVLPYYICPRRYRTARNIWLLLMSLVFYAFGEIRFLPVFLLEIVWNYLAALFIERSSAHKKHLLALCLTGDLGLLAVFKYANFVIGNIQLFSGAEFSFPEILLPIGISFFTFQGISYVVDVYRGTPAQRSLVRVALYIAFFPQLIAGPILRYNDFAPQITDRRETLAGFTDGFYRFTAGLCKKVLLANQLGLVADHFFITEDLEMWCAPQLLLAVFAFALQLYLDFSGYSDMAIGLGGIFGFRIPENFRDPYTASDASDFWRRWHLSLSGWFRDYVYIPLGGSRCGTRKTIRNLLIVWLLTGLWHGANWPCILWGVLWGLWLICEKYLVHIRERSPGFRIFYRILTVPAAMCLFSCLRLESLSLLTAVWGGILSPSRWHITPDQIRSLSLWAHDTWLYFLAAMLLSFLPPRKIAHMLSCRKESSPEKTEMSSPRDIGKLLTTLLLLLGFLLSVSSLTGSAYNPFLYFQF